MPKPRAWYSLQAKADNERKLAELVIYDEIGFWAVTAKRFIEDLHAIAEGADEVLVSVNSNGGDVFDAFAIYNALRRYDGRVTTRVDGVAASSASLIVMAGDRIVMPENAMLMIHNPWTVAAGTAADLRHTAEQMDKAAAGIMAAYRDKSGQDEAALIEMMNAETWLTALEAQALGMCDVIEAPVRLAASARGVELLARYRQAPAALRAQLAEAEAPADPAAPSEARGIVPGGAKPTESGSAAILAAHIFDACREAKIAHLGEAVLLTSGLQNRATVDARIEAAREIAGLCVAAKLPDRAADLVAAGLSVEQVRSRLFDSVVQGAGHKITNLQPPAETSLPAAPAAMAAASIYAARSQVRSRTHR